MSSSLMRSFTKASVCGSIIPRITEHLLPAAGRYVVVQGYIQRVENDRYVVIELDPSDSIFSAKPPPTKLFQFDWTFNHFLLL